MGWMHLIVGLLASATCTSASDPLDNLIPTYGADLLPSYSELDTYSSAPEGAAAAAPMSGEDMLRMSVPGDPGEDYPIYAEVPATAFACTGQVDGGYYADPEAECQAFHVCTADGTGGLAKYSFLCPNGTLFNQANFVCEYWFNVDCSQAESLYGLNDQIGVSEGSGLDGAASSPSGGYAAPASGYAAAAPAAPAYSPPAPQDNFAAAASAPASYEEAGDSYGAPEQDTLASYGARRGRQQGRRGRKQEAAKVPVSRAQNNRKVPTIGLRKVPASQSGGGRQGRARDPVGQGSRRGQGKVTGATRLAGQQGGRKGKSKPSGQAGRTSGQAARAGRAGSGKSNKGAQLKKTPQVKKIPQVKKTPQVQKTPQRFGGRTQSSSNGGGKGKGGRRRQGGRGGRGRGGRQEGGAGDAYGAPALNTGYGAPPADDSYGAPELESSGSAPEESYDAPEDSYGSPALDTGYGAPPPEYQEPAAAAAPVYEEPEYDYEEEPLPTYTGASATAGQSSYIAPVSADTAYAAGSADSSYGAPPPEDYDASLGQADYEYEEDVLPSYNNGVYTDGSSGENYAAPEAGDSYSAPADSDYGAPADTGYGAPADSYGAPASEASLGGYSDPEADILPEYFKSEISLGLNGAADVPRVEPFLSDYGVPQDTYAAASSYSPVAIQGPPAVPDLSYGVPAAPTISLEDYNIPEVSDRGFTGLGGSSYGG